MHLSVKTALGYADDHRTSAILNGNLTVKITFHVIACHYTFDLCEFLELYIAAVVDHCGIFLFELGYAHEIGLSDCLIAKFATIGAWDFPAVVHTSGKDDADKCYNNIIMYMFHISPPF